MSEDRALTLEAEIPASLQPAVQAKLARARLERVAERLKQGDATLWGPPGTPEVADRLGWLTIAERMLGVVDKEAGFTEGVVADDLHDVVLLGMGGSSLAPEVLRRCFERSGALQAGHPRLHVLDSTDAATITAVGQAIDPKRTLFLVSSKSGGTIEPLSLFAHFWALRSAGDNFAAITDPGSGLEDLAKKHGFRRVFAGDPNIGGRYSALSPFGIVPATLMGIDVRGLLAGADGAWSTGISGHGASPADPAPSRSGDHRATDALGGAVWLGAALSALAQEGRNKLTFLISDSLPGLGLWLEQLVAESTGKHATGILPVAEEPPGQAEEYGEDRVFLRIVDVSGASNGVGDGREHADEYSRAGHPLITIPARGPADLGRVFMLAEIAVAIAGWGLEINPFDQPNVQQAKDATNRVLAGYEADGKLPVVADADTAALSALLGDSSPPDYVALMGYLQPSAAFDAAVSELRKTIRHATRATTTFGYGPRFLHSTGQFHKGGPRTGRFLQLLHDGPHDAEIPGAPYTFTTLKNAQAIGDLQTLRELGLPAARVRLHGEDPASALRAFTATIERAFLGDPLRGRPKGDHLNRASRPTAGPR